MRSFGALAAGLALLPALAAAASGVGEIPRIPDTVKNGTATSLRHGANDGFVERRGKDFYLNGELFKFRSMNAPNLMGSTSEFENADTLATIAALGVPATRTYILASVENDQFPNGNVWASESLIYSWNATTKDWNYNEDYLVLVDKMLAQCAEYGVKIIIPFVNQDYGEANDWFGTITDLIRHRYNISSYDEANLKVDWFTDKVMLESFKLIITKALTRRNTVNGRIWGHDDTILAWETGNEMNHGRYDAKNYSATTFTRPAPANWTIEVAKHIKSLAPNTLVQDGSFSRICDFTNFDCEAIEKAWPKESLESEYVDIFSYHFYDDGDIPLFKRFAEQVAKYNKAFVIGEHGFYSEPGIYNQAWGNMTDIPVAGAAIWSMRPHADSSGFLTHSEGSGIYSYHFPGWNESPAPDFQKGEHHISHKTYIRSFEAVGKEVPPFPIPGTPVLADASNATFGPGVTWRGATWAEGYELWAASIDSPFFQLVGSRLQDNVDEGALFIPVNPSDAGITIGFNEPKDKMAKQPAVIHWHDTKWQQQGSAVEQPSSRMLLKRSEVVDAETQLMMERRGQNITVGKGSWYILRGYSTHEKIPGPWSNVVFVHSNGTSSS